METMLKKLHSHRKAVTLLLVLYILNELNCVSGSNVWYGWIRDASRDDAIPVSGGYKPDITSPSLDYCAYQCKADKNCHGFIYISLKSTCQFHSEIFDTSGAINKEPSAAFYSLNWLSTASCQLGWYQHGGRCYLVGEHKYNYTDAQKMCLENDAYLVEIDNELENNFTVQICKDGAAAGSHCWVGMRNEGAEHIWTYPRKNKTAIYFAWGPDEPNSSNWEEECVVLIASLSYQWADIGCHTENLPICEKFYYG